jgi:hypothetical protein
MSWVQFQGSLDLGKVLLKFDFETDRLFLTNIIYIDVFVVELVVRELKRGALVSTYLGQIDLLIKK